jgi:LuxR family maltose regulon positive regulatory protein
MAESSIATAFEHTAFSPDALLATKLYEPRLQAGFVPRRRLVDRLEAGLAGGFVLICAPAGFGKTTLLAEWVRDTPESVAWLSLDTGDNDPARFWRHIVAALDRVVAGIAERIVPLLGPSAPPAFEGLVTALINTVAARPDRVVLVLDDYHAIDAPQVHASLSFLIEHAPPGVRVVLASRSDPPLPLARLRVRGQMTELRAAELRFTPDEAATLLRAAAGADLPVPEIAIAALVTRTEGWAAGLQLAGLSLHGHSDVAGFVETFSGSHRYVLDYLTGEVLERQPTHVRDFLLETSLLERLSGPLCDALTRRADGQAMLETIERANLFLVPLDEVRGWWRYHQLFADLLRARLRQERPDSVPGLHRAAASWHEVHGDIDAAVGHALAAPDAAWAARLIERRLDALILRGEQATVERWVAALPADLVASRPRLLLAQSIMALVGLDVEAVEVPLERAERALTTVADEPFEPSVGGAASMVANLPAGIALGHSYLAFLHGDTEGALTSATRAQALLGEDEWLLSGLVRTHLGLAEWLSGRVAEAERTFGANVTQWRAAGHHFSTAWSSHQLGEVQRVQGRLGAAFETYHALREFTAPAGRPALPSAGIASVGMADLAYERGDLDAARHHATEGLELCRQLAYTQARATALSILARIRQADGEPVGALDAIREAIRLAPSPGLLNPVPTRWARLVLAQGDVGAAQHWINERGLRVDEPASYPREAELLVLVRVLLAQDQPDRCLPLLERLHALAAAQGRLSSRIEVRTLQALALAAGGDEPAALTMLAEALVLGHPQGHVRLFVDEGARMRTLLVRLNAAQRSERVVGPTIPRDYLARLLGAFDGKHAEPGATGVNDLVEPLTAREQEVLLLLATGSSNQGIADELVVTLDTVKKHVSRVLGKLGASNRTEAVVQARRLGLIK